MQRRQFEAYLDKVFDWPAQVASMAEGRQSPRHPWQPVWDAAFLGTAVQIANLHRLEAECRDGVLAKRIDFANLNWPLLMVSFGPTCRTNMA